MISKETQIFGDGENLVMIWKDGTKAEFAYSFKQPIVSSIQVNQPLPIIHTMIAGMKVIDGMQPSLQSLDIKIEMRCQAGDVITESSKKGGLMQKIDLFKNVSVSQMFKIINKKLNKREEI